MTALTVRVDNPEANFSRSYTFARSPVRIGRNPLNDLVLEWSFVSQWHAVIQFDDSNMVYFDLGSTNGTLAYGRRLKKNVPVPVHGLDSEFRIGSVSLTFGRVQAAPVPVFHSAPAVGENERTVVSAGFLDEGGTLAMPPESTGGATVMFDPSAVVRPMATSSSLPGSLRVRVQQLRPLYQAYRGAWAAMYQGLVDVLGVTPLHLYGSVLMLFAESYPEALEEPQLRELAQHG